MKTTPTILFTAAGRQSSAGMFRGLVAAGLFTLGPAFALAVPIEQASLTQPAPVQGISTGPNASVNAGQPASSQPAADLQGSTLWQLYQQVQQLQQEIRVLRGQLEAQQDGLERAQKELKNRYTDLDQRLELLKEAQTTEDSTPEPAADPQKAAPATPPDAAPAQVPDASPQPAPNSVARPAKPASRPSATAAPKAASRGVSANGLTDAPLAKPAKAIVPNQPPLSQAEGEKQAYIAAYDAYKAGGAAKAIQPMQQFIASHPGSVYVSNAYYWLGEFYLANEPADFVKAKKSFQEVVNKYPKSPKAATALYRLATITQEIDKRPQEAVQMMKKLLKNYPDSSEAQYAKGFLNGRA